MDAAAMQRVEMKAIVYARRGLREARRDSTIAHFRAAGQQVPNRRFCAGFNALRSKPPESKSLGSAIFRWRFRCGPTTG